MKKFTLEPASTNLTSNDRSAKKTGNGIRYSKILVSSMDGTMSETGSVDSRFKIASPPSVNSPLGSAKMNHVAANSSTLSASSEPPPAPLPPPPSISFGADPSNNVISVPEFQVKFLTLSGPINTGPSLGI